MSLLALIPHAPWDILVGILCLVAGYKMPPYLSVPFAVALAALRSWIRMQEPHLEGLDSLGWFISNLYFAAIQLAVHLALTQVGLGLAIWIEHAGGSEPPQRPIQDPNPAQPLAPSSPTDREFSSWETPNEPPRPKGVVQLGEPFVPPPGSSL